MRGASHCQWEKQHRYKIRVTTTRNGCWEMTTKSKSCGRRRRKRRASPSARFSRRIKPFRWKNHREWGGNAIETPAESGQPNWEVYSPPPRGRTAAFMRCKGAYRRVPNYPPGGDKGPGGFHCTGGGCYARGELHRGRYLAHPYLAHRPRSTSSGQQNSVDEEQKPWQKEEGRQQRANHPEPA